MGTWLRQGARVAALVAVSLTPMLTGSGSGSEAAPSSAPAVQGDTVPAPVPVPVLGEHRDALLAPLPPPQEIEPQTTLVAKADRHRKVRDGRGHVWTVSSLASHDLPQAALTAYRNAAATLAQSDPACQLPWTLLAGIGRVESDHGRYGGSVLSSDGVSRPAIIGVALNGRGPVAAIHDTDGGKLDGDTVWDRAVGPMQFIPSTWEWAGRDGDGDGKANPDDIDDTALAAAAYLCSGSGSMLDDASAKAAIFRYNPSDYYVALVQAFERGYRTGIFVLPSPPPPPGEDDGAKRKHRHHKATEAKDSAKAKKSGKATAEPQPKPAAEPSPKPSPKPSPTPKPSPSPTPKPSPSPGPSPSAGPTLVTLSGDLAACDGWCVGGTKLDLGPDGQLAGSAIHDFDKDGTTETMAEELAGMVGAQVTLQVGQGTGPAVVYVIDGVDYRFGDGTFA